MLTTDTSLPLATESNSRRGVNGVPILSKVIGRAPRILFSIGDQCIVSGTNFLTMVILGRACGLSELGVYSLAYTVVVILMAVQESLLIAPYTVIASRLRGTVRRRHYAAATLMQQLFVACAASLAFATAAVCSRWLMPEAALSSVLSMLSIAAPFWLLKEYARRVCFVELNTRQPILLDSIAAAVQLSLLGILWHRGALSAAYAMAAAGLAHACAATVWWSIMRPAVHAPPALFRRAVSLNWALGSWTSLSRVTEMMHIYSMHWLLAFVSGPAATGAYAAAASLLAVANPVLLGIGNLLAPETARAYATGGIAALRRMVVRASGQVTLVTAVFVILLAAGAEPLLILAFGEVQEQQAAVVAILSIALLIGMTGFGADNGLRALARPAGNFKAELAGWAISVVVASVMIGAWDARGAAMGALAGHLTATLVRVGMFARIARERSAMVPAVACSVQ